MTATYTDNVKLPFFDAMEDPFYPRFWPEKLIQINPPTFKGRFPKARGIFVCDMSDLFGIGVPEEWTTKVLDAIRISGIKNGHRDRFYLLTKQPQNLNKFFSYNPLPTNCWVGVSYAGAGLAKEGKALFGFTAIYNHMKEVEAKIKFLSIEPMLRPVTPILDGIGIFDWIIIGAQTKPYNPPKIEWVQEIVEACDEAGVPVFLKNNLSPLIAKLTVNDKWVWAKDLGYGGLYRQEMPSL